VALTSLAWQSNAIIYGFFKEQGNASLKKLPCSENLEIVNSILIYLAIAAKESHFCDCSRNMGQTRFFVV